MKINKKMLLKVLFVIILIAIIVYTFRDSADSILAQIKATSPLILAAICISSVIYHLFEAWITYSLAKRYNPDFKYYQAVQCAMYCSFYRLSTLGSGTGVAAIVFLGKHGVEYSQAIGLYMIQYVMHKVSIAIFSGILFVINWPFMVTHYRSYGIYLIGAYALTVLISIGLILFAVSKKFHKLIFFIGNHFNKSGKLDNGLTKLKQNCDIMEKSISELIRDVKTLIFMILQNMIKLVFWYAIPFLIVMQDGVLTLINSLAVSSLSVMTAAVVPTPAGIGAVELIMTNLFGVIIGVDKAGAVTVLYRIATFIFPFVLGGIVMLIVKIMDRGRVHRV